MSNAGRLLRPSTTAPAGRGGRIEPGPGPGSFADGWPDGGRAGLSGTARKIDIFYRGAVTSPPQQPFPYAPPPRKRRTWVIVLASMGVLTILVCALGLGRLFFRLKHVSDIDKEVDRVTAAFIDDSRDGLSQAGYDGLCAEAKEEFRPQDLATPPPAGKVITGYRIVDTSVEYARGQADVLVEVERADGSTTREVYIVDEDAEQWRMCAFPG